MTSALGNYIHRSVENYIQYGTGKETRQPLITSYNAQKKQNNKRINALKNTKNDTLITEICKYINAEAIKNTTGIADKEDFFQNANKIMIQFLNNCGDYTKIINTQKSQSQSTGEDIIQKLIDKQNEIYKQIENINKNSLNNSQESLKELSKKFEEFKKLYNRKKKTQIENENISTTNKIKKIMDQIVIKEIDDKALKGAFGEYLFSAIVNQIDTSKDDALKELKLTAKAIGEETSPFKVTKKQVPKKFSQSLSNTFYYGHSSQNKIDVSIEVNDKIKLGASVKTYTSRGNSIRAHLQDINLLYSLLATASQFGNHWINLHSLEIQKQNRISIIKKVDLELNKQIIYEALASGNLLKKNVPAANTFIAIDVRTGKVYYNSTYNILNDMIDKFNIRPKIETLNFRKINQGEYTDANARISALLAKIHETKLNVVFNIPLAPIKTI